MSWRSLEVWILFWVRLIDKPLGVWSDMSRDEIFDRLDQIAVIVTDLFVQSKRNDDRLRRIEDEVRALRREFAAESGKLNDVSLRIVKLYNRLETIESCSAPFNQSAFELKQDAKKIYREFRDLWDDLQDSEEVRNKLDEYSAKVEVIEDRLAS